jgi:hypothetical protein
MVIVEKRANSRATREGDGAVTIGDCHLSSPVVVFFIVRKIHSIARTNKNIRTPNCVSLVPDCSAEKVFLFSTTNGSMSVSTGPVSRIVATEA